MDSCNRFVLRNFARWKDQSCAKNDLRRPESAEDGDKKLHFFFSSIRNGLVNSIVDYHYKNNKTITRLHRLLKYILCRGKASGML